MNITYLIGDATQPIGEGLKIIVHVCNDIGAWGRGFVMEISKKWPEPERCYRSWHRGEECKPFALGEVQFVKVSDSIWVANLIGQRDVKPQNGIPPVRYEAIQKGLKTISTEAKRNEATIHMPRIGCGLAGGQWGKVGKIVEEELINQGVPVTVYDLAPLP